MKRISIILFLLGFLGGTVLAQMTKKVDEVFPVPAQKMLEANLKFAHKIEIKGWERQEIGLKKTISYSDESLLNIDQQSVEEQSGKLIIQTDYNMEERKGEKYNCWSCNKETYNGKDCICFQISYVLMLPPGMDVELETISGDIVFGAYAGGEIVLNTISGGIEIKDYQGMIEAKSISGFVDYRPPNNKGVDISCKSVTGEIYTDYDLKLDEGSTAWSKRLNRKVNGGGKKVALETVSGDIFFRKAN